MSYNDECREPSLCKLQLADDTISGLNWDSGNVENGPCDSWGGFFRDLQGFDAFVWNDPALRRSLFFLTVLNENRKWFEMLENHI